MAGQSTGLEQASPAASLRFLLKAMRPKQWVKNAFVFAGIVFAGQHLLTQPWALLRVAAAFVLFSLISGCVYLINDLADIENDRQHPRKRFRPLASGRLSPNLAYATACVVSIVALGAPFALGA